MFLHNGSTFNCRRHHAVAAQNALNTRGVPRPGSPMPKAFSCNGMLDLERDLDSSRKLLEIDRACRVDLDQRTYTEGQHVHQVL